MKFMLLGAFALLSVNAFAQHSPAQVCQVISQYSGQSGAECAGAISRGFFDQTTVEVAHAIAANGSYSSATKVMQMGANRYLDDDFANACISVARYSGQSAASCVEVALDQVFEPALGDVARVIADNGSYSSAVTAIQNARNGAAHPSAAEVCKAIARYSGQSAAECVAAIINKDYFNGSESVCLTLANNGSYSSAVTCMRNSGVPTQRRPQRRYRDWDRNNRPGPTFPGPGPQGPIDSVVISQRDLRELSQSIRQARNLYDRNQLRQLGNALIDLERKMDEIKATSR